MRTIMRNRTGIEDWIISKANYRRQVAQSHGVTMEPFIYPYNLGIVKNIRQVRDWPGDVTRTKFLQP